MLHKILKSAALLLLIGVFAYAPAMAQQLQQQPQEQQNDYDRHEGYQSNEVRIDRYLNVEIWTDQDDGEYYEGDRVTMYFRASRDAFVAIYSIDSKGRVNMLFPSSASQDNYVVGGVTHSLPSRNDDYDLVVSGPEGVENIQIIASRERFPIPDWYPNSGMLCDWENRHDYMDWVNGQFFVKYGGQSFAYDRTAMYIYEWEPQYFKPVYRPYYPGWTVCGNAYVDYWYGSSVYIDGIYWGCAPLYLPRLYVGWHTFTVYDSWGHCWERDVHVTRYNTVVLDYNVIVTRPDNRSKYKDVRFAGYQQPVKVGYKDYDKKVKVMTSSGAWKTSIDSKVIINTKEVDKNKSVYVGEKKFLHGTSKIVTTERGIETAGADVKGTFDKRTNGVISTKPGSGSSSTTMDGKRETGVSSGSIFKRRDTDTPSDRGVANGQGQLKTSDVKRKSTSSVNKGSNDEPASGSYKKSNSSPVKRNTSSQSKVNQTPPKKATETPKKSSGTAKSGGSDKSEKPAATSPKKSSDAPKKKTGVTKKKGGGN